MAMPGTGTPRIDHLCLGVEDFDVERITRILAQHGVTRIEPAAAAMKRLGKSYEPHVYPKATHSFVVFQEVAGNPEAVRDGWHHVERALPGDSDRDGR